MEHAVLNEAAVDLRAGGGVEGHAVIRLDDGRIAQLRGLEHHPAAAGIVLAAAALVVVVGGDHADGPLEHAKREDALVLAVAVVVFQLGAVVVDLHAVEVAVGEELVRPLGRPGGVIVVDDVAAPVELVHLGADGLARVLLRAVDGHGAGGVAQDGAEVAGLVEVVLFAVEEAVGIHLDAREREKALIGEVAVIHEHVVVGEGHHAVAVGQVVRLDLFGGQPPVGEGGVAVQVGLVAAIGSRQ